ncbi:MAG: hypothetical protein AAF439_02910 [Pseudomonadota bacterium]
MAGTKVSAGQDDPKDLNGVWQVLNTANFNLEPHHARHALQLRDGPHGPVPAKSVVALGAVGAVPASPGFVVGGTIPYTSDALRMRDQKKADWINRDPEITCFLPGVPRATYMPFPFQIVQSDSAMLFVYEYANAVRSIHLTDPGEAPIDSWMGQSYGSWDGETFVIEVTAQNGQTWLDRAGNHGSAALKVKEFYTKEGPNHIRYRARLEDAATYTRPWEIEMILYRRIGADAVLQEFNCVEFVEELMYGHLRREPLE